MWHYVDPTNPDDANRLIDDHIDNLTTALVENSRERAAFEAAWLSHTIVDALTPAHHYPLSDKIEELWGKPKKGARLSEKMLFRVIRRDQLSKNWQYWGARCLHDMSCLSLGWLAPSPHYFANSFADGNLIVRARREGFETVMREFVWKVFDQICSMNFTNLAGTGIWRVPHAASWCR